MSEKPILLTSDVHLGVVPSETEASFCRWLSWAATEGREIVLNGDVFDFWFEYRSAIPRGHSRVLGTLADIVDAGIPVTMMGGNHDWWGGDYLTAEIGVEFLRDPTTRSYAGFRTLLAHGDGLGSGDLGYRLLRLVLRGRLTIGAFRWLHPDLGARVATLVSQTEHRAEGPTADQRRRNDRLREWAHDELRADPELDLVVLGHTHVPVCEEVSPGQWYANAGDWVQHRSYLRLEQGVEPRVLEWEG